MNDERLAELREKYKNRNLLEELSWGAYANHVGYTSKANGEFLNWLCNAAYRAIKYAQPGLQQSCNELATDCKSDVPDTNVGDTISRQAALNEFKDDSLPWDIFDGYIAPHYARKILEQLPSVQPEKETAKRVLWTGWKGTRNTRYKCLNCKKPVKNDDVYCHRCGQKLMFPHISFTDYIPGEKQELIVRWDDE